MDKYIEDAITNINERLDIIEKSLEQQIHISSMRERIAADQRIKCKAGQHKWKQVEYDLQGGTWGKDRCTFCRKTKFWSYRGAEYYEKITEPL